MLRHPSPRITRTLDVGFGHALHIEEYGIASGIAVVVVHGGPGAGCGPALARFFDPEKFRIVLFDQRGSGRSTPRGELLHNTTWDLVDDLERIRGALDIESWLVFGGSWGSTLALTYASQHAARVLGLVLRGVFLLRREEIEWFYEGGARRFFPRAYDELVAPLREDERGDVVGAYYKYLTGPDEHAAHELAERWTRYELATSRLHAREFSDIVVPPGFAWSVARIETHYFVNRGFFASDTWLSDQLGALSDVPCTIVQGRYDMVCPPHTAFHVHQLMPHSKLVILDDAGHASSEPSTDEALRAAVAEMADRIGSA